jgi:hypothetical protein
MHMLVSEFFIYPEACWFEVGGEEVGSWKGGSLKSEGRKLEVGREEVGSWKGGSWK